MGLVVGERLSEPSLSALRPVVLQTNGCLLGAGEDRPGDLVVDQPFARHAMALVGDRQLVRAEAQALDEALERPVVPREGAR